MIGICVQVKIKKKQIVSGRGVEERYIWGIVYCDKEGLELYAPVYPYILNENDLKSLKEFLGVYEKELIEFYQMGNKLYFAHFLFGFDTICKKKFKEHWYQKGVIVN